MSEASLDSLERDWAQLGVLFACDPSGSAPDPEKLLLDTARKCPENARLLPLAVTWLVSYGQFIARHRLKRLVQDKLEAEPRAVLGLILDEAVRHSATRELLIVSDACRPLRAPVPLSRAQRDKPALARIAERRASELSRKWGVWSPPTELKPDAVRPVSWLLGRNPGYRERIIRKGDLRVSIIETLRRDLPKQRARSELALAKVSGATHAAVRKALAALVLEGSVTIGAAPPNNRDHPVVLNDAA